MHNKQLCERLLLLVNGKLVLDGIRILVTMRLTDYSSHLFVKI